MNKRELIDALVGVPDEAPVVLNDNEHGEQDLHTVRVRSDGRIVLYWDNGEVGWHDEREAAK